MPRNDAAGQPVALNTAVVYNGTPVRIVGRAKPVGQSWRYDLRIGSDGRVVRSVTSEMFVAAVATAG